VNTVEHPKISSKQLLVGLLPKLPEIIQHSNPGKNLTCFVTAAGIFKGDVDDKFKDVVKKIVQTQIGLKESDVDYEEFINLKNVTFHPYWDEAVNVKIPFIHLFVDQIIGAYLEPKKGK
jgi:hypothetical protein